MEHLAAISLGLLMDTENGGKKKKTLTGTGSIRWSEIFWVHRVAHCSGRTNSTWLVPWMLGCVQTAGKTNQIQSVTHSRLLYDRLTSTNRIFQIRPTPSSPVVLHQMHTDGFEHDLSLKGHLTFHPFFFSSSCAGGDGTRRLFVFWLLHGALIAALIWSLPLPRCGRLILGSGTFFP